MVCVNPYALVRSTSGVEASSVQLASPDGVLTLGPEVLRSEVLLRQKG